MAEYIITVDENDERWHYVEQQYTHFFGYPIAGEIVRCRDCEFAAEYTTGALRCIGYLVEPWDYYEDKPSEGVKVEPYGFCAWGERREP